MLAIAFGLSWVKLGVLNNVHRHYFPELRARPNEEKITKKTKSRIKE